MRKTLVVGHLLLLSAILALGLLPPPALAGPALYLQPAGETLTLDAYWQRMRETHILVQDLNAAPAEVQRAQLDAAAAAWTRVTTVVLPDGTPLPVDHTFLAGQLRADPPNLEYLDALLGAWLAARDSWPHTEWSAADLEALDRILARPEFQWQAQEPSALARWWERVQRSFWGLLERLAPRGWGGDPIAQHLLTTLGIAALGAALFFALRGVLTRLITEKELGAEMAGEEHLSAAAALKRAEVLAGERDYRTAVRYLYLSALLLLEEKGRLRYDRTLTNREYLHSVADLPELAAALRQVVEVFERVWYGYELLDEPAYRQYKEWVTGLGQR